MLHIGDKVTLNNSDSRVYTIGHICTNGGALNYRGYEWETMISTDLFEESDATLVEHTLEPNPFNVGDEVLVSKYTEIRVIQESSGAHRAVEWGEEPSTPIHGVVDKVDGVHYRTYRVLLDNHINAKVEERHITRAGDYTLF